MLPWSVTAIAGHSLVGGGLHERPDARRAIQHRVLAVHMEMHEGIAGCHWFSSLARGRESTLSPAQRRAKLTRPSRPEAPQVRVEGRPDRGCGTRRGCLVAGCSNPSRLACSHCLVSPSFAEIVGSAPYMASPTQGCRCAAMCTRIWWVRPVSSCDLEQRRRWKRLERLVVRDAGLAVGGDRELPACPGMSPDRRVDGARRAGRGAPARRRGRSCRPRGRGRPASARCRPTRSWRPP